MNKTQSKTIKDFEEKLNVNPEFFGLFRDELLNMNTDNINLESSEIINNNDLISKKESTKTIEKLKKELNKKIDNTKKELTKTIDNTIKESTKTIHIINDASISDDLNTKLEIENKKTDNLQSSTVLSIDDLKNLKLNKYELYKLEEIIKYFYLIENQK